MVKKVLFTYGHARAARSWKMFGEILSRLVNNPEIDVYWLRCNGKFAGHCWYSTYSHFGYCKKCKDKCSKISELIGFEKEKIFSLNNVKTEKFPKFSNIQELLDYSIDGYNLGLSPASTIMTLTRDYMYDINKWQKHINKMLKEEYTILSNVIKLNEQYRFDEIHVFTGRTPTTYPLISFAKKNNIPYIVYEAGSNPQRLRIDKGVVPHDFYGIKNSIKRYWENGDENKFQLAEKWFVDRRSGKFQAIASFTKDQKKNMLPADFNEEKENIVFFNTSSDEVAAYDSWKHPFAENDNIIYKNILEHYKNDKTKHFYLRVHPNLTDAKENNTTQMKEIYKIKKDYDNITIIEPDEKVDTYALVEAADKVITTFSSVGCEATFWGSVSITAGKALYEDYEPTYKASSMEELYGLIDNKDLVPKPKESALPYGYFNQVFGEDYKYFDDKSISDNIEKRKLILNK